MKLNFQFWQNVHSNGFVYLLRRRSQSVSFQQEETLFHSRGRSFNQKALTNCFIYSKTITRSTFNNRNWLQVTKETNQYLPLLKVLFLNLVWLHPHLKHLTLKCCLFGSFFLLLKCILF